jgi:uncharacterized protein (TIGR03437 family)
MLRFARSARLACAGLLGLTATAQARIRIVAVVNTASYQAGIPEPGSLATIFCTGLSGITGVVSRIPESAAIAVGRRGSGVNFGAARLLAVADLSTGMQQINFQVPPERWLEKFSMVRVAQHGTFGEADSVDYPGVGGFFSNDQCIQSKNRLR